MSFYLPSSSAHVPGKKKKKGKKRRQQGCMVSTARPQANTEVGRWSCVGCLLLPRVTLVSVVALSALTANGAGVAVLGWALRCPLSRAGLGHPGLPGLGDCVGSPRAALAPQDNEGGKAWPCAKFTQSPEQSTEGVVGSSAQWRAMQRGTVTKSCGDCWSPELRV